MLASELFIKIAELVHIHGDCPIYYSEEGSYDTSPATSIEAITQQWLPLTQTLVPAGTTYFLIR